MRQTGRFHLRATLLAWVAILAIVPSSLIASAASSAHPITTTPAPSNTAARFIQSAQTLTVNGSSAQSITILSTENVVIVSPLVGIAFFYDTACSVLNGSVGSPFSDSAASVRANWGSTFSVAPTSDAPSQVDDCHQISIVDPTPTPTPTNTPISTNTPVPTATPTNTPIPTATPTSTSTPIPTPTLAPDQIAINGSEASSVTAVTDGRIHIESASGWIAFYSDDACADLSGTERSPLDQASSLYIALYGTSFSVRGVTESTDPTTSCRQVSIVDPTPTPTPTPSPTPTMFMTINGSTDQLINILFDDNRNIPVKFDTPEVPGGNIILHLFPAVCGEILIDGTSRTFPGGGAFNLSNAYLLSAGANRMVAVYAERDTDGAKSPCQTITFPPPPGSTEPTATPASPPLTPTVPATSTAMVTGLPQTGSGPGSSPGLPAIILGTAMAVFVAALGIERRRHRRVSR